jgi:thiosulfate/3-mercaptopyruvate sulfurtransferase
MLGRPGGGLVDVRSPEEYRGELLAPPHLLQEQAQRPGHIPGARNIPWVKAVDPETGAFLPTERLRSCTRAKGW